MPTTRKQAATVGWWRPRPQGSAVGRAVPPPHRGKAPQPRGAHRHPPPRPGGAKPGFKLASRRLSTAGLRLPRGAAEAAPTGPRRGRGASRPYLPIGDVDRQVDVSEGARPDLSHQLVFASDNELGLGAAATRHGGGWLRALPAPRGSGGRKRTLPPPPRRGQGRGQNKAGRSPLLSASQAPPAGAPLRRSVPLSGRAVLGSRRPPERPEAAAEAL